MFLKKPFHFNTSIKTHSFIGALLSFFILFIIFFLKPFDTGTSNFAFKTFYFLGYGIIPLITYLVIHLISIFFYEKTITWKLYKEIIFCLTFTTISVILAFLYTEIIINKKPERIFKINYLLGWFKIVFLGFGNLLFILTFFLRKKYVVKKLKGKIKEPTKNELINNIRIFGSLKKDSFLIDITKLVYIKSEDNYVTLFFFEDNLLKEKLFRSTLVNIKKQLPSFLKIHRSYIVNPEFIISLKGNKQNAKLYLKSIDYALPVSIPFFKSIHTFLNSKS